MMTSTMTLARLCAQSAAFSAALADSTVDTITLTAPMASLPSGRRALQLLGTGSSATLAITRNLTIRGHAAGARRASEASDPSGLAFPDRETMIEMFDSEAPRTAVTGPSAGSFPMFQVSAGVTLRLDSVGLAHYGTVSVRGACSSSYCSYSQDSGDHSAYTIVNYGTVHLTDVTIEGVKAANDPSGSSSYNSAGGVILNRGTLVASRTLIANTNVERRDLAKCWHGQPMGAWACRSSDTLAPESVFHLSQLTDFCDLGGTWLNAGVSCCLRPPSGATGCAGPRNSVGAIQNFGSLHFEDSAFRGNLAASASCIHNHPGSEALLVRTDFADNWAHDNWQGHATTLKNDAFATMTIRGCTFRNNVGGRDALSRSFDAGGVSKLEGSGGAVYTDGATLIEDTIFSGNQAAEGGAIGSAKSTNLYFTADAVGPSTGELRVLRCTFSDNEAFKQGGGAIKSPMGGRLLIEGSVFERNRATNVGGGAPDGGALQVEDVVNALSTTPSLLNVTDSTFHANVARRGAGIFNVGREMLVHHSTFSNNHATGLAIGSLGTQAGAGIFTSGAAATLETVGFVDNVAPDGAGASVYNDGSMTYLLPTPRGEWMPARECYVYREACSPGDIFCAQAASSAECRYDPNRTSIDVGGVATPCPPVLPEGRQSCSWSASPSLLGRTIFTLAPGAPQPDGDFPFPCSPGVVGGSAPQHQASPLCAGICPAGFSCEERRTTLPVQCPAGNVCEEGTVVPVPCPAGTSSASLGLTNASGCTTVPAGTWAPAGAGLPIPCARGTYNPFPGQTSSTSCLECPSRSSTSSTGSGSEAYCLCHVGWYKVYILGVPECRLCPLTGADCAEDNPNLVNGTGATLTHLPSKRNYWRTGNGSAELLLCPVAGVCLNHSTGYDSDGCRQGHEGPYCGACASDYFLSSTTGMCVACEEADSGDTFIVVMALLIPGLLIAALVAWTCRTVREHARTNEGRRSRTTKNLVTDALGKKLGKADGASFQGVMVKAKILVSLFQVVKQMPGVYHISMPPAFANLLSILGALDLDIPSVMNPLQCNFGYNFHWRVVLNTAVPLVLLALLWLLRRYCASKVAAAPSSASLYRAWVNELAYLALLLLWFTYPSNSTYVFNVFNCETLDDGRKWLTVDYSIDCALPAHEGVQSYSALMIFVYPLGVPLLFLILLRGVGTAGAAQRTKLLRQSDRDMEGLDSVTMLVEPYRPGVYWWEVAECLRKVFLVGLVVFTEPESVEQMCIGLIIAVLSILIWAIVLPYRERLDNYIMLTCQVQIFFVLLSGLVLRLQPTLDANGAARLDTLLILLTVLPVVLSFSIGIEEMVQLLCAKRCGLLLSCIFAAKGTTKDYGKKHRSGSETPEVEIAMPSLNA